MAGYDITVRYDNQRKNFSAFAVLSETEAVRERIGISAYAKSRLEALSAVLVKLQLYSADPERFATGGQSLGIG